MREKWQVDMRLWSDKLDISSCIIVKRVGYLILIPLLLFLVGCSDQGSDGNGAVVEEKLSFNERVILASDRVKAAVVSVVSSPQAEDEGSQGKDEQEQTASKLGSGIIIHREGKKAFVVTSQQVIEAAATIDVVLSNGKRQEAKLIGSDRVTNLAVLQIDSKDIQTVVQFGDSDQLETGQSVIAIGNPLGLGHSQMITAGRVQEPLRKVLVSLNQDGQLDWEIDLVQTDVTINRGNSGGALVDLEGTVIGISSFRVNKYGVEGLGYAIPSNQAMVIIDSLMEFGKVKRPFMGVSTIDLNSYREIDESGEEQAVEQGVLVLEASGPAEEAGIQTGDIITHLDDREIGITLDLRKYLYLEKKIGEQITISYSRDGVPGLAIVTLVERESDE